MMKQIYSNITISHVRQTDMAIQTNEVHQKGVAQKAESFADKFDMGEWGLHCITLLFYNNIKIIGIRSVLITFLTLP